jgi:predicted kinase
MKELILLRGLPGAGKSTFAKMLGGNHIEADMYFINEETGEYKFNQRDLPKAHNWCSDVVEHWMDDNEEKIVVSNTFTSEWEFMNYYRLAEQYGYRVHSLIVENRHGSKSIHNVPDATMGNMLNRFNIKL